MVITPPSPQSQVTTRHQPTVRRTCTGQNGSAWGGLWGGLWGIAADRIPALDRAEGDHNGIYRREILRVETDRGPLEALVYIEDFTQAGEPRDGYVDKILAGAVELGLPDWWQHALATWV